MQSWLTLIIALASFLLVSGCRLSPAAPSHAGESPCLPAIPVDAELGSLKDPYINDVLIQKILNQELSKMVKAGKGTPGKTLRDQAMKNRKCQVSLPVVAEEKGSLDNLYGRISDSVLVLGMGCIDPSCRMEKGHYVGGASAFVVSADGLAVTNFHVVNINQDRILAGITRSGRPFFVKEVLAADPDADVALVRLEGDGGGNQFTPLPIRSGAPAGTEIVVVSHPRMAYYTMTRGIITRRCWLRRAQPTEPAPVPPPVAKETGKVTPGKPAEPPAEKAAPMPPPAPAVPNKSVDSTAQEKTPANLPAARQKPGKQEVKSIETLMIDADYAKGSSGAPVCDLHGAVVGIVSSTANIYYRDEPNAPRSGDLQMVLKQCVPVEKVLELLSKP
jgi:S1-C subfamily serine protease